MCRKFIKQEREVREEVSRMSSRPLFKVHEDMASICQTFTTVTSELQRNARAVSRLKHDTSQVGAHVTTCCMSLVDLTAYLDMWKLWRVFADVALCRDGIADKGHTAWPTV